MRCFSEDVWTSTPSIIIPCSIAYTLLGDVMLRPSDKLLKSCPFGHILECRGVASAVSLTLDKIEVHLDFHIFDTLDFDLLIGYPLESLLTSHQGSLAELLRKTAFATATSYSENLLAKPIPKQNTLEEMMHSVRVIRARSLGSGIF